MGNVFDDMKYAISQARATQRAADQNTSDMIGIVAGRLKSAGNGWSTSENLKKLKRELRDFNITTGAWKDDS